MSDLISRQQAIDELADMHCKSDEDGYVWIIRSDAWARIDALPSVTQKPKAGKWEIYVISPFDGEGCRCSECKYEGAPYWDYCPNCGARMTEEDV